MCYFFQEKIHFFCNSKYRFWINPRQIFRFLFKCFFYSNVVPISIYWLYVEYFVMDFKFLWILWSKNFNRFRNLGRFYWSYFRCGSNGTLRNSLLAKFSVKFTMLTNFNNNNKNEGIEIIDFVWLNFENEKKEFCSFEINEIVEKLFTRNKLREKMSSKLISSHLKYWAKKI